MIIELANYVPGPGSTFLESCPLHASEPSNDIVTAGRELLERGITLFSNRPDKEWSLTDCITFVVMEEHGATEALMSDGDFEQAGFVAVAQSVGRCNRHRDSAWGRCGPTHFCQRYGNAPAHHVLQRTCGVS